MTKKQFRHWLKNFPLFARPLIMGILNITPDSFYDGGNYVQLDKALTKARELIAAGADIIDIGGESSRPGAYEISTQEELDRVIPIIEKISLDYDIAISIDTIKAKVMQAAAQAGACLINDISGLGEQESISMIAALQLPVCIMHMQGKPQSMQQHPYYKDVIHDINLFFTTKIDECLTLGIKEENIIIDPGFGFGKTVTHNLKIIKQLKQFKNQQGRPILLGVSRKSTLGTLLNKPVSERLIGGIAMSVIAALNGASILRTHDVEETKQALIITEAVVNA